MGLFLLPSLLLQTHCEGDIARSRHGQVEEPHRAQPEPEGAPEPHPQAFEQEAVQDEGDGPQVSEEPQVLQEAQPEHCPAAQEGEAERRQQIVLLRSHAVYVWWFEKYKMRR